MSKLCYNKGCGKQFDPSSNAPNSCKFHSGAPVFHEGMKFWSCCPLKKYTDFQEFLGAPGCEIGPHAETKPEATAEEKAAAAEKQRREAAEAEERKAREAQELKKRQDAEAARIALLQTPWKRSEKPLIRLALNASDSVRQAGRDAAAAAAVATTTTTTTCATDADTAVSAGADGLGASGSDKHIEKGTICKNNACGKPYRDDSTLTEECLHHPGSVVFHEGAKFWSCCKKRTYDFNEFLSQQGCTSGQHVWFKPKSVAQVTCRHDWFQMGSDLVLNIYAKKVDCDASFVEANETTIHAEIYFDTANKFVLSGDLSGLIDPNNSQVQVLSSKIEVKLKKADGSGWKDLLRKE